uniref:Uncharacterized protein n=1 Tax=Aegilops tauschii subsp. strangulata TaxID=200361 RepID=A0A452ZRU4_AEGTS
GTHRQPLEPRGEQQRLDAAAGGAAVAYVLVVEATRNGGAAVADGSGPDRRITRADTVTGRAEPSRRGDRAQSGEPVGGGARSGRARRARVGGEVTALTRMPSQILVMPSGEELVEDSRFSTDPRRSEVLEEKLLLGMPWKSASDSICPSENQWVEALFYARLLLRPFQYANYTTADYAKTGKRVLEASDN